MAHPCDRIADKHNSTENNCKAKNPKPYASGRLQMPCPYFLLKAYGTILHSIASSLFAA
jgi:hypothetical protein